jgi:hypothetical protein
MLPNIQERFESLSEKRRALLQHLDSQSPDSLSFKAGPDKWSVVEAIEHLVIVEDNFLEQVGANIPVSTLDPEKRSPDKYQIVLKVMQRDVEVDVPHESMEPHGHGLLGEIDEDAQDDMVYQHPYAGPLNIAETLEFIEVHLDNHVRHIDVILERVGK